MKIFILALTIFCSIISTNGLLQKSLKLELSNIKQGSGLVLISLYDNPDQFPYEPYKVVELDKSEITSTIHTIEVEGLDNDQLYAITLLDDENRNKDMDFNIVGIPKEGYGFSNNAKPRFLTAPSFSDCAFQLRDSNFQISIKMKYW